MSRKAFLIMNPGLLGDRNYAPTVENAYNRVKSYLKSPVGGYWHDEEILELARVADYENLEEDFCNKMEAVGNVDVEYSLIVFIGHGGAVNGNDSIQLKDRRIIPISTLITPVSPITKRMVIIDACRSYVAIPEIMLEQRAFAGDGQFQGTWCRDYYNHLIAECEPHVELIQSTQYGQYAHGSQTGTAFMDALLGIIKDNLPLWNSLALMTYLGEYRATFRDLEGFVRTQMDAYGQVPQYTNASQCAFPLFALKRLVQNILND